MNLHPQTHLFRPRFTRLQAAIATAGVLATAAVGTGVLAQAPATAHAAGVRSLPLSERVLPSSALPGFVVPDRPIVVRSALAWAARVERMSTPSREAQRLRQIGFVGGVNEQLRGVYPLAADAVSTVERFRSAAGANAEFSYQSSKAATAGPGERATALRTGMPGAFGWVARSPQLTGINVMFTSGPYVYVIGSAAAPGTTDAPTWRQIIADAQLINLTVNGCVQVKSTAAGHRPIAARLGVAWPMPLH
ncbi:MAG TPA: hypothetical protein VHW96_10405 [Solirubrobacteraceae bacterium]|jgi:hypothetical protein|nr:hypothetical protein [Solirubrobacteraceae bacterium]